MNKRIGIIIAVIFDIIVSIPFIASNWYIWYYFNGKLAVNIWGPLQTITILKNVIGGGEAATIGGPFVAYPNYPFILFWVALAGNFVLIVLSLRSNNKN